MQMAENAKERGKCVYAVGRNSDMRQMAGKAALTSVVSVWSVYYTELFDAKLNGRYMEQNWNGGYAQERLQFLHWEKVHPPEPVTE